MSAASTPHLDLTAPDVVRKISQRSLVIGGIFAVIAVVLPSSGLMSFIALTCSASCAGGRRARLHAILMIRHLTGGGWVRSFARILGALCARCRCWQFLHSVILASPPLHFGPKPLALKQNISASTSNKITQTI